MTSFSKYDVTSHDVECHDVTWFTEIPIIFRFGQNHRRGSHSCPADTNYLCLWRFGIYHRYVPIANIWDICSYNCNCSTCDSVFYRQPLFQWFGHKRQAVVKLDCRKTQVDYTTNVWSLTFIIHHWGMLFVYEREFLDLFGCVTKCFVSQKKW